MTAFDELMSFQRDTGALAQIAGRLSWDQEVMMPHNASDQRSEEVAVLETVLHARRTDPRVGDWLAAIDASALDEVGKAQVREISRSFRRSNLVPAKLAADLARLTSRSHRIWAEARADDNFAAFAPVLEEVVKLKREEGAALADGGDIYDALLDDYEPSATATQLSDMFGALRPRLVALRQAILAAEPAPVLNGTFDEQTQMKLSELVARTFGYDMSRGRLDKSVHPFTSGSGDDVRITTRTNPLDPFNSIYSTIHETGHAAYELAVNPAFRFTPLGQGVSMGVHESQSRIYENQLGRSRPFTAWLYGRMTEMFGDLGLDGPDAFYKAVNRVQNNYIRTESDEVQYNLHVLLRFDLEQALIKDDLQVADLETAWNDRFLADFGFAVDKPSDGVLQDVHWSAGLFGYFPTYSLGNVYAGCLLKSLKAAVPDLDAQLEAGDLAPATAWLGENVQRFGGLYAPRDVITRACGGEAPSEAPLLDYLEEKFTGLYDL